MHTEMEQMFFAELYVEQTSVSAQQSGLDVSLLKPDPQSPES